MTMMMMMYTSSKRLRYLSGVHLQRAFLLAFFCCWSLTAMAYGEYEELDAMEGYKRVHITTKENELLFPVSKWDFETLNGEVTFMQYRHDDDSEIRPLENMDILRFYLGVAKNNEGNGMYKDVTFASYGAVFGRDKVRFVVEVYEGGLAYSIAVIKIGEVAPATVNAASIMAQLNMNGRIALYFNFESGESNLSESSQRDLFQVIKMLREHPDLRVKVEGHTDNVGSDADNMSLSKERANAIKRFMVSKGIAAARIVPEGFGSSKPIADNETEEGRNKNRRVELVKLE